MELKELCYKNFEVIALDINLDKYKRERCDILHDIEGIDEWYINDTENILIVKYHEDKICENSIKEALTIN